MARRTTPPPPPGPPDESPFPPLEDDPEAAALADEANADNRVDLGEHEPAPIGGFGPGPSPLGMGGLFGGYGEPPPMPGRPTSPTMWANAHLHEGIPQVRVWKKVNGIPILVGEIDAKASEPEFIRTFFDVMPKPGEGTATFVIRPIDMNGREVREEISLPPISEHHTELKRVRAVAAGGAATPAVDLSPLHALLKAAQDREAERVRALESEAKADRERTANLQQQLVERQLEAAQRGAMSVEAVTERLLKAEQDRVERAAEAERQRNDRMLEVERSRATEQINMTTGLFTHLSTMTQQAMERERIANDARMREEKDRRDAEREEAKLRLDRERLEWQQRWEREKAEEERKWQREKAAADAHAALLESERQRQHEARMREMELAATRDREHAERMAALLKTENKEQSLEGIIEKGTKLLSGFGLSPTDLLTRIFTKEDEGPNPLMELGMGALKEGMKVAGEYVRANAQVKATQAAAAAAAAGAPMVPPVGLLPPPLPTAPFAPGAPVPDAVMVGPDGAPVEEAPPVAAPAEPGDDLPLSVKKPARVAIRNLVGKLRTTPDSEWQDAVAVAISGELAIYHYVKAVSIRYALVEGGADQPLVDRFFANPACALIPADVPRG